MGKGESTSAVFHNKTVEYQQVKRKIERLFLEFGHNLSLYPAPSTLFDEFESIMERFGHDRSARVKKLTNYYKTVLKKRFESKG